MDPSSGTMDPSPGEDSRTPARHGLHPAQRTDPRAHDAAQRQVAQNTTRHTQRRAASVATHSCQNTSLSILSLFACCVSWALPLGVSQARWRPAYC
eukprot:2621348-Prymnesium_polylepis.1